MAATFGGLRKKPAAAGAQFASDAAICSEAAGAKRLSTDA